jgi:hypothetical protein
MQMDKMILNASNPEDVLTILVTHRGALFLQNLVTSLGALADMSQQSVPFSKAQKFKFPEQFEETEKDKLLSDPRYTLLNRDLIDFSSKLDLESIESIMHALQTLNHAQYKLFGSLLRRLYSMEIQVQDIPTAISVAASLEWGGFGRAETFYNRLNELIVPHMADLGKVDFINTVLTFSKLPKMYGNVLTAACTHLPDRIRTMTPKEIGYVSLALSTYGGDVIPASRHAILMAADVILSNPNVQLRDYVRVSIALRRTNISDENFFTQAFDFALDTIKDTYRGRIDPSIGTISDIAQLVDSSAHFGISMNLLPVVKYLEDHIDIVTEESAIRFLFGLAMNQSAVCPSTILTVNMLIRKIGGTSSTAWEKHKTKIMMIWFAKCMQWPTDSEIRKFIIDKCLAHFLIARRGYQVPFVEDGEVLWKALKAALHPSQQTLSCVTDELLFNAWVPNSPFNADILIPSKRIAVLVLSQFDASTNKPVGNDLLECQLVSSLGWEVIPIDRKFLSDIGEIVKKIIS